MEQNTEGVLYETRHHVSKPYPPNCPSLQEGESLKDNFLSLLSYRGVCQLKEKWSIRKRPKKLKKWLSLFVSPRGERVAVAVQNQITILQKGNDYTEPCGVFTVRTSGWFACGTWSECHDVLGVLDDSNILYFIKGNGEEITRITMKELVSCVSIIGLIFPIDDSDVHGNCLCGFNVLTLDGLLRHIKISMKPSSSVYTISSSKNHSILKQKFPKIVFCWDYCLELSLLAVVGNDVGVPVTPGSNAGWYLLSLWHKTRDLDLHPMASTKFEGLFVVPIGYPGHLTSPKVHISPQGKFIATLDVMGCLNIFKLDDECCTFSNLSRVNTYDPQNLIDLPIGVSSPLNEIADFVWWSDQILALAYMNGFFTMLDSLSGIVLQGNDVSYCMPVLERVQSFRGRIFLLESTLSDEKPTLPDCRELNNLYHKHVIADERMGISNLQWSLISFSERSVSEMYNLLIRDKKYQAALDFSYTHGLDRDEVFKSQWLQSEQGISEINSFLKNIKDKDFVLSECVEKVGSTEEAVKALLDYGLHLTDQYRFSDFNVLESSHMWNFRVARLKLLQFRDMLDTFLGIKMGRFSVEEYTNFRISPISKAATTLAEGGKIGALNLLFKRHPYSLATSMLTVLSAIPETVPVRSYVQLLPGRLPPSAMHVRENDWVECEKIVNFIKGFPENHEFSVLLMTEPIVHFFLGSFWPSSDELCMWYKKRTRDIDTCSGQLDNSHCLVDFACQKGFFELQPFCDDIYYLHEFVYFHGNDGEINFIISLVTWEQLSNYDKFKTMLRGVQKETVVETLHKKAIPFMRKKLHNCKEDCSESYLVRWLKEIAVENKIDICLVVLEEGCMGRESDDDIFNDVSEAVYCVLECIYLCNVIDRWSAMAAVLSKLSHIKSNESTFEDLNKRLKLAEGHVEAGRLLAFYQVPKPMAFLLEASSDEKTVKQIIRLMLSKFMRRHPGRSDNDWANMWRDMQSLHEKVFPFLDSEYMLVEFCRGLLKAGRFSLARNYLKGSGSIALAPEKAENLVIQSAREYFFSASTLTCSEIWKAKQCLNLLPSNKNIKTEAELIEAITVRLPDLGVTLLPMQFRQIKDPMEIIKMVITNQPGAFLEVNELIEIAKLLGLNSVEDISAVEESIAREAAVAGDLQIAFDLCLNLCRKGHGRIWDLCAAIARGPALENIDVASRKQLLGFALSHCDEESIGEVLNSWKDLDMQEQCEKLMLFSNTDPSDFSVEGSSNFALAEPGDLLEPADLNTIKNLFFHVAKNLPFENGMDWESFLRDNGKALCFGSSQLPWLIQLSKKDKNKTLESVSNVRLQAVLCLLSWLARNGFSPSDDLMASLEFQSVDKGGILGLGFPFPLNIPEVECGSPRKRREILMTKFKEKSWLNNCAEQKQIDETGSTNTLIALKSSQLATAISPAIKISPDDLLNTETAFSRYSKLCESAVRGPDLDVLLAILESWEVLFKTQEIESVSDEWSHDGWEEGWESFQDCTAFSVHPLKSCWLEILKKLVTFSRFKDVLNLMDRYLENLLLDEDGAEILTLMVLKSDCLEAFKISLLLPHESIRLRCLGEVERVLNRDGIPESDGDLEFLILVLSSGIAPTIFAGHGATFSYARYLVGKLWHEQSQSQRRGQRGDLSVFRDIVVPFFVGEVVKEGQVVVAGFMVGKLMGMDGCVRKYLEMELGFGRGEEEELGSDGCLSNCVRRLKKDLGSVIQAALFSLDRDAALK